MYSPKIQEGLIPRLYRKAKDENVSMTVLVNEILSEALDNGGREEK